MNDNKEKGNEVFKDQKYEEALKYYIAALDLAKQKEQDTEIEKIIENDKTFYKLKYSYLKICTILNSNSSMANLKMEHWSRAINNALKGKRMLERLEKLMDDDEQYEKDFGLLKQKLNYRMKEAWTNQDLQFRFVRHSDVPEEGLTVGSLIEHIDSPFGESGIFASSKVLMYEFVRGESIKGVIINKGMNGIRLGGPCGLRRPITSTDKIYFHNIPDVPGSKRVIEGVYWHDGNDTALDQYRNNPAYKINEYYGFASWFEGQLDGEI